MTPSTGAPARPGGLPAQPGYPAFLLAAALARLASEMFPVAAVLLVLDRTGRPGLAGTVVAATTLPAVVTGPVSKEQLYAIGFAHPGQTEFVAERCGVASSNVAMMLAGPTLRTVPVTTHLPLALAIGALTTPATDQKRLVPCSVQRRTIAPPGRRSISHTGTE